ncbi:Arginine N-methyltransferase 2 [Hypocenomyce scalaris]|nr:Arginine N-methyltransferase 2 [Hypocenomyce scalaris]
MEAQRPIEPDPELDTQKILLASSNHDFDALRILLRTGSANVQDRDTGFTPLHAAIAACELESENALPVEAPAFVTNGHVNGSNELESSNVSEDQEKLLEAAKKTMRLLLMNGAIWNDLNKNDETPGCLALRLGLNELYEIMVDAGVRAEMLLNRLNEGWELLGEEDDDDEEGDPAAMVQELEEDGDAQVIAVEEAPADSVADASKTDVNSEDYLQSDLSFQHDRILDSDGNGVMMAWETDIMKRTADLLVPQEGLRILNLGHGMGIIDSFFQQKLPSAHHIVEAHPKVVEKMKKDAWHEKSGVTVHEGKWQDVVPRLIEEGINFDAIYFDTFAEDYKTLRNFFTEHVIGLLDENGKWGFFNGLGADRQVCYDVYTKVVEMDALEAGFDTEWESIEVPNLEESGEWKDIRRRYWVLKEYKLPIFTYFG